jgi:transposase
MIAVPSGVRVWLAVGRTDMRRGMNGLALQVQEALKRVPHAGDFFVFRGARGQPPTFRIPFFVLRRSPIVGTRCSGGCCRFRRFAAARN